MRHLDLRGLKCPLPVLKTRKFLKTLEAGEEFSLSCTDPLSAIDIPNLIRETGDILQAQSREGEILSFAIRKAAPKILDTP